MWNELDPNWIRSGPDQCMIYMTNSSQMYSASSSATGGNAVTSWLGPNFYACDLYEHTMPADRRIFGLLRKYNANGIHADDTGLK